MATSNSTTLEMMAAVPEHLRGRIVSGMRWTLWLSVLAAPFGYATTVLLARTGPEVIGTYGLLMVYIGVVSSLFYLGGDTVVMKFVPELAPEKRLSFLASYFLVVLGALVPWLAAAALWPAKLHYLLGERAGAPFLLTILYLSPIYLIFSVVGAALKAMLEWRWAQTLLRVLTLGSFLLYATLFIAFRGLLKSHYTGLIWGIYLGLAALVTFLGLGRLLRLPGWPCPWRSLRFFLPRGFWSYTLSLEQASAVSFFSGRLDLILVLNFGGLKLLGSYVAIVVIGDVIRVAGRAFLDTLLPSLTNLLARRNLLAASQVLSLNLRILFLVYIAATCGLMFLAGPITGVLGARYVSLRVPFLLMALFLGLSAPGAVGGILLSSVGKQQRAVWIGLGQIGLFTILFLSLWPRWQLLGAVLATGISLLLSNLALLAVAKYSVPLRFSAGRDYVKFVLVGSGGALVAMRSLPFGLGGDLLAWAGAVGLFLVLARYRYDELRQLLHYFLPGPSGAGVSGRAGGG